jgi:phosphoribosyl 1,2-cyclic phosphodiesterase
VQYWPWGDAPLAGASVVESPEQPMAFEVKFWGVRGSIACATPQHVGYGGNTSCIEVVVNDGRIILDAGTGIRLLGKEVMRQHARSGVLLLTHTHWDHVNGFPFFAPVYVPGWQFRVMAGHLIDRGGIREALSSQMTTPMFPVPLQALRAEMSYEDFRAGDTLTDLQPGVVVKSAPLNHPNGATGYRIEYQGRAVAYITDTEHTPGTPDKNVLGLMEGADLAIYDCTYTDDEYPSRVGWGHSTWQEGVRLARQAGVRRLAIFHHDPDHTDDVMEKIESQVREIWSGAIVAREGMTISI